MTQIQRLIVPGQAKPVSHYCHVVRAGDHVWVSVGGEAAADCLCRGMPKFNMLAVLDPKSTECVNDFETPAFAFREAPWDSSSPGARGGRSLAKAAPKGVPQQ